MLEGQQTRYPSKTTLIQQVGNLPNYFLTLTSHFAISKLHQSHLCIMCYIQHDGIQSIQHEYRNKYVQPNALSPTNLKDSLISHIQNSCTKYTVISDWSIVMFPKNWFPPGCSNNSVNRYFTLHCTSSSSSSRMRCENIQIYTTLFQGLPKPVRNCSFASSLIRLDCRNPEFLRRS